MQKISGDVAYTVDVAASYERDRFGERLWQLEDRYMLDSLAAISSDENVLDIPVGTGRFISAYKVSQVDATGVDISPAMLAEARLKDPEGIVKLYLGDARSLPFPDDAFSHTFCWRLTHLLPLELLGPVTSELARVTKQKVFVEALVHDSWHYLLTLKLVGERILRFLTRNSRAASPWTSIKTYSHKESELLQAFAEHGLTVLAKDVLGNYGTLRVKIYVLTKNPSTI